MDVFRLFFGVTDCEGLSGLLWAVLQQHLRGTPSCRRKKVQDNKLQNPHPQTLNIEGGQGAVRRGKLEG